jgi:hypothetical protein
MKAYGCADALVVLKLRSRAVERDVARSLRG